MNEICRLCLRNDDVYKKNIFDELICESLYWTFGVEIDTTDEYSKLICQKCLNLLEYVIKWKNFFQMNQHFLQERKCPPEFDIETSFLTNDIGTQTEESSMEDLVKVDRNTLRVLNSAFVSLSKLESSPVLNNYRKVDSTTFRRHVHKRSNKKLPEKCSESSNPIEIINLDISPLRLDTSNIEEPVGSADAPEDISPLRVDTSNIEEPVGSADAPEDISPLRVDTSNIEKQREDVDTNINSKSADVSPLRVTNSNIEKQREDINTNTNSKPADVSSLRVDNSNIEKQREDADANTNSISVDVSPLKTATTTITSIERRSKRKRINKFHKYASEYDFGDGVRLVARQPKPLGKPSSVEPAKKEGNTVQILRIDTVHDRLQNDSEENVQSKQHTKPSNDSRLPVVILPRLENTVLEGYTKLNSCLYKRSGEDNGRQSPPRVLNNKIKNSKTTTPNSNKIGKSKMYFYTGRQITANNSKYILNFIQKQKSQFGEYKNPSTPNRKCSIDGITRRSKDACNSHNKPKSKTSMRRISKLYTRAANRKRKRLLRKMSMELRTNKKYNTRSISDDVSQINQSIQSEIKKDKNTLVNTANGTSTELVIKDTLKKRQTVSNFDKEKSRSDNSTANKFVSTKNTTKNSTIINETVQPIKSASQDNQKTLPKKIKEKALRNPPGKSTIPAKLELRSSDIQISSVAEVTTTNPVVPQTQKNSEVDVKSICQLDGTLCQIKSLHFPELLLLAKVDENHVLCEHNYSCVNPAFVEKTKSNIQTWKKVQKFLCSVISSGNDNIEEHYNAVLQKFEL